MKYIIPIFIISLFACSNSQEVETDFSKVVLIDTFDNELVLDTSNQIKETIYQPLYIGEYQEEIPLKYLADSVEIEHYYPHEILDGNSRKLTTIYYKYPDSSDLKLFVDTSKIIGSAIDYTYEIEPDMFRGKYKSYPVFFENVGSDTLNIGFGNRIFPYVEAKDSLGNWRPIQRRGIYFCGTGLQNFYLKPNNILISSCKLYDGNYQTKLRLVYYRVHSNEFEGTINYSQFD